MEIASTPSFCNEAICGGSKENNPKGSGSIKSCGLVKVAVPLLEEAYHCGDRL